MHTFQARKMRAAFCRSSRIGIANAYNHSAFAPEIGQTYHLAVGRGQCEVVRFAAYLHTLSFMYFDKFFHFASGFHRDIKRHFDIFQLDLAAKPEFQGNEKRHFGWIIVPSHHSNFPLERYVRFVAQ